MTNILNDMLKQSNHVSRPRLEIDFPLLGREGGWQRITIRSTQLRLTISRIDASISTRY